MTLPNSRLEEWPIDRLTGGFNARQDLDITLEFQESITAKGVLSPPWVTEDGRGIAGARRTEAARRAGHKTIWVRVFTGVSEGEIVNLGLVENVARKDLTPYEIYLGLKRLREACPNMRQKDIAKGSGMSEGMLSQTFALDKLCPEAMEAFKAGLLGTTKAYQIATSPDQLATLALFMNGETRDAVAGRSRRTSSAPAVRASKIKVPLVSGATVTVAGEGVSMDEALEAVQEAAKQIKAAIAKGITAKNAMGYWKDIAAAG